MIRSGLKKLAAQKKKSVMTSVKQRHVDQIIDDVGSGCVCGSGQTLSDSAEIIIDQADTVTPVTPQAVPQSASSVSRNGNGGNMMALPRDVVSVAVHASANQDPQSGPGQSESVQNVQHPMDIGQGSVPIQNNERSNITEPSERNEATQNSPVLRQRSTITVGDLDDALKTLTGKGFSEIENLNLSSIEVMTGASHGSGGLSLTLPGSCSATGISAEAEQQGTRQPSQQNTGVAVNLATTNQD